MTRDIRRLLEAFATLTRTIAAPENMFGSASLELAGVCDGLEGVQWNCWIQWHGAHQLAYAGVNLEGKVYDGWPVARLIERELDAPRILAAAATVQQPEVIEAIWYRDAWQVVARPPILEKLIGGSPRLLHTLDDATWRAMLIEAYACLDEARGHRARARQTVTMTTGANRTLEVSPHLQFRQAFWPRNPGAVDGWRAALDEAMSNLRPLHTAARRQARP